MQHAPRVCSVCKARKKRCDKRLPRCGFCAQRDLICDYSPAPDDIGGVDAHIPTIQPTSHIFSNSLCDLRVFGSPEALDTALHFQVCRILRLTGSSIPKIGQRFFRHFYRWLPIMSPAEFDDAVSYYYSTDSSRNCPPPADFATLLLSLCLITWQPSAHDPAARQPFTIDAYYTTLRALFTHVQASMCSSISLLRASLVMSAFDYARGRPWVAYISMGMCTRMALTVGIDKPMPQNEEHYMLWWGVMMMERLILCEISDTERSPLPFDSLLSDNCQISMSIPKADMKASSDIACLDDLVQATYFLEQVLCVISQRGTETSKMLKLVYLDANIQAFLTTIIGDCGHEWRHYCGAIGTVVRSLFLLHNYLLSKCRLATVKNEIDWTEQSSCAALTTATQIMVDVARDHLQRVTQESVDLLPLSCSYNLRTAIDHIREGEHLLVDDKGQKRFTDADVESLGRLYKIILNRWETG